MEQLVFQIYRLLYTLLYFLLKIIRLFLPQGKLERSLVFRFDTHIEKKAGFDPTRQTICIHASSGEIEYAYPLIKKIKENFPTKNILVTLSSPSVLVAVKNNPYVDAFGPAPLDTFWSVNNFLSTWKPKLVLYARTDVWPEFSSQVLAANIPSYIFSCTFSENSTRAKGFSALLAKFSFENLNHIFTVSAEDKENLKKIGIKTPIEILGDTRYDQIENKKKNPPLLKNLFPITAAQEDVTQNEDSNPDDKKIFVAGSTWEADEKVIIPIIKQLAQWKWIIAPHEVDQAHLSQIAASLKQHCPEHQVQYYSSFQENKNWDILIVDQFGKLFFMYEYADASFVGGSFKDKVHSVMEPLAFNKYVFVGPYFQNNREALEFSQTKLFTEQNLVQVVHNSDELKRFLEKIQATKSENRLKDYSLINEKISQKRNATDRVYKFIFDKI